MSNKTNELARRARTIAICEGFNTQDPAPWDRIACGIDDDKVIALMDVAKPGWRDEEEEEEEERE